MTATTTLGVVVQMTPTTFIRPSSSAWAGLSSGSIELVGDPASSAGLSLTFDGPTALERLLDAGRELLASMRQAESAVADQQAWADYIDRTGRPPLRAVSPDEAAAASRPLASCVQEFLGGTS
jgi:hypothetical protein